MYHVEVRNVNAHINISFLPESSRLCGESLGTIVSIIPCDDMKTDEPEHEAVIVDYIFDDVLGEDTER